MDPDMRRTVIAVTLVAAACSAAPKPATPAPKVVSAAALADRAGDSVETAVAVPANAPNEGVDFENNWIYDRFGRFRRHDYGIAHLGDRRYDVITVELPDGSLHKVFFDITEMWNNWKPPAKP